MATRRWHFCARYISSKMAETDPVQSRYWSYLGRMLASSRTEFPTLGMSLLVVSPANQDRYGIVNRHVDLPPDQMNVIARTVASVQERIDREDQELRNQQQQMREDRRRQREVQELAENVERNRLAMIRAGERDRLDTIRRRQRAAQMEETD